MGEQKVRLLIIDDELASRIKIKKLLYGNDLYEVVAEFEDGTQALELIEHQGADIVLMDMNMPQISGVELIQMMCAINEDVHFIAISGYEDFEYVRGCLKNDRVSDYLLKHQITREGLIQALDDMQRRYAIQPHAINQEQDDTVRKIFEDEGLSDEEVGLLSDQKHLHIEYSDLVVFYLSPDMRSVKNGQDIKSFRTNVSLVLGDIVGQVIKGKHQYVIYRPQEKDIAVLVSFANVKSYQYILNTETVMAQRIQKMAGRMLNITVTIWIGEIQSKVSNALKEYRTFRKYVQFKVYGKPGDIHLHSMSQGEETGAVWLLTEEEQKQLRHELLLCREEELYAHVKSIFQAVAAIRCERKDIYFICRKMLGILEEVVKAEISDSVKELEQVDFIEQYEACIWSRYERAVKELQKRGEEKYDPVVAKAVTYICENFKREITLETCATHMKVSYTHMSRIFKKETGVKFTEYLNKVRVNHAQILIGQRKLSLKEIVQESGFSNYNYFFKVFKEIVGVSPGEYNKKAKI